MQSILYWPPAISFLIVSAVTTAVALAGLHFVRKKYPAEVLKENHEVAAIIFNAFGLLYGVVVAFVVFVTWSGYDDATKNLQMEANETIDVFYSAKAFSEPVRQTIQQQLMDYNASVYNDELKRMSAGQVSLYSGGALRKLVGLFYEMDENTVPNKQVYAETLRCVNKLVESRRMRIFAGNNTVPLAIWLVLLIGGLITVSYTYFFGMKNIKAQYLMTAALTVTITMILVLIYILDHPFTGPSSVSSEPLRQATDIMQRNYQGGARSR
jgi:Na+/proline symporter